MSAVDVITLGEAMVLFVACEPGPLHAVGQFEKRTAGAETNVAVGLARLGLKVCWISKLGDDSMGRYLLESFRAEGVDCSLVQSVPGARTGFMFKGRVDDGSDPPIEYHRRGSAASTLAASELNLARIAGARHLHLTGIFPALSAATRGAVEAAAACARAAGRTISFDPNLRPTLWPSVEAMRESINELASLADWVLPGVEEGRQLTGRSEPQDIARFYRARGAKLVAVKLGGQGAWYDGERGCGHVPAFPVARVVDTVGAGDGFAVGLISGLLEGLAVAQAVRRGTWIGARAVQVRGDTEGLPTRVELLQAGL